MEGRVYIHIYTYIYIYTPYFGHLHVSVQNMPLKILKEYQRSSMSKFAGDESSLNPLDYTQLKCVCVCVKSMSCLSLNMKRS